VNKYFKITLLVFVCIMFLGCTSEKSKAVKSTVEKTWKENLISSRKTKDSEFKNQLDSPMAGSARFYILPDKEGFINIVDSKTTFSESKEANCVFSVVNEEGKWKLLNISKKLKFVQGSLKEGFADSPVLLNVDRFSFKLYPGQDRLTVIVFDKEREILKHFKDLKYFTPDVDYHVEAELKKFEKPEPFTVYTTRNEEKTYYRYGFVHFKIKGTKLKLTAYKFDLKGDDSNILFIPFRDLTSGELSYGAGRYLEIPEPKDNHFILDFNYAFNPLCNYSNGYNCPLAPAENILEIKILAGEKIYPHL